MRRRWGSSSTVAAVGPLNLPRQARRPPSALSGCVATFRFVPEAMRSAPADEDLYATDLAEALVVTGVPFREAHRRVGELLKALAADDRRLRDLRAEEWKAFGVIEGSALLDPDASVRSRGMAGGPSPDSVRAQASAVEAVLPAT